MLQEDLASGRTAAEAAKEADARREANRRRREAEAAAEVKSPVLVRTKIAWCSRKAFVTSPSGGSACWLSLLAHVIYTYSVCLR